MDFAALISKCDDLIRAGQGREAVRALNGLNVARVPREFRLKLANLARRSGLVTTGLRLLTPIVHPQGRASHAAQATAQELAEYAVLLQRSGAVHEAMRILSKISDREVPEVHLYQCYCLFNIWDYQSAITPLETFLARPTSPYMAMVAEVNLCSALLFIGELERCEGLLAKVEQEAIAQNAQRLRANCLEMRAQIHVQREQFEQADAVLAQAEALLNTDMTFDQLFILKWKAISAALRHRSETPLREFRPVAQGRNEPEAVRDADLYTLRIRFDAAQFASLYWGTPFTPYRERLCRLLGQGPPQSPCAFGQPGADILDLRKPQGKLDAVLVTLLQDFYRPRQVGTLFSALFPAEQFNIFSSPGRVRQLIYRTRRWIEEAGLPLRVESEDGLYSLHLTKSFYILLPGQTPSFESRDRQIETLRTAFTGHSDFTAKQAQAALNVSSATCKRILQEALSAGKLERHGAGSSTIYYFTKQAA